MLKNWLRRTKPAGPQRVAPHAEWVEQRLLYSADAASLLGLDTALAPPPEERTLDTSFEYGAQAGAAVDVRAAFALTPLQFEADAGQLGAGVDFAASGVGYAVRLGGGNAELLLDGAERPVTLELVGAHPGAAEGQEVLATRSNYLVGTDSSKWVTDIVNYGSVLYRGVYDGIDIRYYGNQQQLEYDFLVGPGADASQLQLRMDGIDGASIDANGDLVLRVAGTARDIRFQAPVSYQEGPGGREAVQSRYELQPDGSVRIVVGDYDTTRALVVDPVLAHGSYLGEAGNDTALAVAVGPDGSVYVTGQTTSTSGAFGTRLAAGADANESYVAKLNADLTSLLYVTRVGGSAAEEGDAIAVDAWGNAIVTGWTKSDDFIVTAGADQATRNGNQLQEAFVYKLNAAGNGLVFSTYFGGAGNTDVGSAVTVDSSGNVYVAGTLSGTSDNAFLNKYTSAGAAVQKLQYGGSGADGAKGVAVDAWGNMYLAGNTQSTDNVTLNGAQSTRPGADDVFLARYSSSGVLGYATYVGAGKADVATGLAVDSTGRAYVVGRTKDAAASGFATTAGAFDTTAYSHETGFLRIYNTAVTGAASLEYSTFIGGSRDASGAVSGALTEYVTGVAVSAGKVVVVGHTDASDLPTTADAYSRTNTSGDTGFAIVLAPQGGGSKDLIYGTYYGTRLQTGGAAWNGSRLYLVGSSSLDTINLATADGYKPAYVVGSGTESVVAQFSGFTNVAPMLSGTNSLASQLEDVPAAGTLVSDLVAGKFTDADAGTVAGIAVTGFDASRGSWQFSVDGGTNWSTMTAPAAGSALLLNGDALTRVRFAPDANFVGSSSISFRAWDRSAGTAGTVVTIPTTGGSSAFSLGQRTATVTVAAVNDAPVRTGTLGSLSAGERTSAIAIAPALAGVSYAPAPAAASDESAQALRYVVTELPVIAGQPATGTILLNGTPVAVGDSLTWTQLQSLTFLPGRTGTATFTFSVKDDGGTANGGQDTLAGQAITFTVTNVAPVLTVTNVSLPAVLEDVAPNTGVLVSDIVAGKVTDGGGAWGIAVVGGGNNTYGSWQYSLDNGATWTTLAGTSASARLLGPDAWVRFAPSEDSYNSAVTPVVGFTFRAWDGSTGVSGGTASVGSGGGTTAFSTGTATADLYITPVNDIPERADISLYSNNSTGKLPPPNPVTVSDTSTRTLNLGYLEYMAGYSRDEYARPFTITITELPTANSVSLGTVKLGDGSIAVKGAVISISQLQGATFQAAAGLQGVSGWFRWEIHDSDGTANGGVDLLSDGVQISIANSAPVMLSSTGTMTMLEDAQTSPLVSALVTGAISDLNGAAPGIAVTGLSTGGGGWWQWSGDGGTTWTGVGGVSTTNALLLGNGSQWRLRFLPSADWNSSVGTSPTITYRGWDGSTGTAGSTADTTVNGGTTAFSAGQRTVTLTVTPVNDAPVRTDIADRSQQTVNVLDGAPLTSLGLAGLSFGRGGLADEAGQTLPTQFRITGLPDAVGRTYLSTGVEVVLGNSYSLADIQGMKFLSFGAGILGKDYLTFDVKDSGGIANGGVDTLTFSLAVNVNRAPVLSGANSPLTVQEDFGGDGKAPPGQVPGWANAAQRAGVFVSDLVTGKIVDTTADAKGIAIIAKTPDRTWQYSLDGGTTWLNMPAVTNATTLLLAADANTKVRFIPDPDWNSNIGVTGLTFRAWDQTTGVAGQMGDATYNGGASAYSAATATSTVYLSPRNDAPVATGVVGGSVVEGDAPKAILVAGSYAPGPSTASDEAGQILTVTFGAGLPAQVQLYMADGVTLVDPLRTYTIAEFMAMKFASTAAATPGVFQLTYTVQDNGGTTNGVDAATFSLALTVTNKAPLLAGANPLAGIQEDTPDTGTLVQDLVNTQLSDPTRTKGIAVTAVDNSHGTWQYTRDGGTTWTAFGTPTADAARLLLVDAATRVRFVPPADWNGTATLTFAAWDATVGTAGGVGNTTANGGTTAFSAGTATTSVTVAAVNDPPVLLGGAATSLTVAEDSGSTSLGLGAVGYGPGGGADETAQTLAIVAVDPLPAGSPGTITLADGTAVSSTQTYTVADLRGMRFVTAADGVGTATFTYRVRDSGGGTDALQQQVVITVTPVNDAPAAGFDLLDATEDTVLTLTPDRLLANDVDVDGDTLTILSVASGSGGTVALSATGDVVFTPDADFSGMASFSYGISDGQGGTSITGVVLRVAEVNDAPRLAADVVSGSEDQPLTIAPSTLLGNDIDVEGDSFTITGLSGASGGTVAFSGTDVVFTPDANFNGQGGFSYTVTDARGGTATAAVTVNVAAVNDPPVARTDALTTKEDTPLSILPATLLANDSDLDGDTLSVSGVANGNGGTVSYDGTQVLFTPDQDFTGKATFDYTVSDGKGGSATSTVSVDVTPVNDPPVAKDDYVTATTNVNLTIDPATLLGNDGDVDGDALSIVGVGGAVNGIVTRVGQNIVFVSTAFFTGPASFTYTVSDGQGGTSTAVVHVDVQLGNVAPVGVTDNVTTDEDAPLAFDASLLLQNDTDANVGDVLSVTGVSSGTGGTVTLVGNTVTFTPGADFNGAARFNYTVSDNHGAVGTGTVNVTVNPLNDPPRPGNDTVAGSEDQVLTVAASTLLANDRDVEGQALSITAVAQGTGGTVELAGTDIIFRPDANFNGKGSFSYTVSDASGATAIASVTVDLAAVNDAPIAKTETLSTDEDAALTVAATALLSNDTDVDAGDVLSIVGVANGTGGTVTRAAGGNIVFTPNANFNGNGSFSYTVADQAGSTSTVTVTVTVAALNDDPVAKPETLSGTEDQVLVIAPATLLANDTDVDGNTLSVTQVGGAIGGTVELTGGNIVFRPTADVNGTASFVYTVEDGKGGSAQATATVKLAPVNDAPVGTADGAVTNEDAPVTILGATLLANDSDVDGDTLAITQAGDARNGTVVLTAGGDLVFTPTRDFHGTGSFTYTVSDGQGGTATVGVTVTVNSVNDDPVANPDTARTAEDTPLVITPALLLANDGDVDGDLVSFVTVASGAGGQARIVDGNILFTPDADFNGTASFTYTVADGQGGSASGTVSVDVTAVNDAPRLGDDVVSSTEDTLVVMQPDDLLANDSDPENDALVIVAVGSPSGGTAMISGNSVVFTPDTDFNGRGSLTYTVRDAYGNTSTGNIFIDVQAVNDAPVGHADVVDTTEDTPLTVLPAKLLANDTDVEGDALRVINAGEAKGGSVAMVDGNVVFTPDKDFNGFGSFSYTVADPSGATGTATVTVRIAPANDAPVATGEAMTTLEDTPLVLTPAGLLANDTDVDGDALEVLGVASGSGGSVEFSGGNVTFTPDPDFSGAGSFSYVVSDGKGGTATATVTVRIDPVNDNPVAGADTIDAVEDTPASFAVGDLLSNDSDVEKDVLAVVGLGNAVGGKVERVGDTITFTPAPDFNGDASFSYTVSDGNGGQSTGTVTVKVSPVEDVPVAMDDSVDAVEDTQATVSAGTLLGNDQDADRDTLAITSVTRGQGGNVALSGTDIVFTPDADFNGDGWFTYIADDGHGGTAQGTVTVKVAPRNDAPVAVDDIELATEDQALVVDPARLLANDRDIDGDVLTLAGVTAGQDGTVEIVDGAIVFRPNADFNGATTFGYTVSDLQGGTASGVVTVKVAPVNDAPVVSGSATVAEGGTVAGQVQATDVEKEALTYALVSGTSKGTLAFGADGSFSYTHDGSETSADSFVVDVTDASGATTRATVGITVTPVNDAPVVSGSATVAEGGTVAGQVKGTDAENQALTYALVSGTANGKLVFNGDGSFTYTHDGSETTNDAFLVDVTDASGATTRGTVNITVTPVNDAPVVSGSATVAEGGTVAGQVQATDAENEALTYTLVSGTSKGTLAFGANGSFSYTHDGSETSADFFVVDVRDASGATTRATVGITVTPVNDAPVVSGSATVAEGGTVAGQVKATDAENETLAYVLVSGTGNGALTFNPDGSFSYKHDGSETSADSFVVDVTDASGATTRATVGITVTPVNDAPAVSGSAAVAEGATVAGQVKGTDAENEALTYALASGPANGTLVFNGDGSFTYTHDGSETTNDAFLVDVTDASGATTRGTVNITVTPVNDAPVVSGSATVAEGGTVAGQVKATDAEKETLAYVLVSGTGNGALTFNADGSFSYTHDGSETSGDAFLVDVTDASGAKTRGTVNITVTPVNDAPQVSGNATVAEGATVDGQVQATDAENEALAYTLVSGTKNGTLVFNTDGSFRYTHDGSETSADAFVIDVTDASGATTRATVNITVTPVNDAPVVSGSATVAEGGTVAGQVKATDAENETLAYTLVSGTKNGVLVFNADGSFRYTHDGSETSADAFVVDVTDASGATTRSTVGITVTPVNDAPIAGGSAVVAEGGTVAGQVKGTDAENEALTYALVSGTSKGTLSFQADGSFSYTHDGSETAADSFVVQVTDASGATSQGTVNITVTPVNDAPAVTGSAIVAEGATVSGRVQGTDAEGESLSYALVSGTKSGTLRFNSDGTFSYTHDGSETLGDAFVVDVTDASGATSRGTIAITVTPVNDAPVVSGSATVAEGGTAVGQVQATDAENETLTYAVVSGPANGKLVFNPDGSFSYTHDGSETSGDSFAVDVTDASGATTRATVGITVTPVNDVPAVNGSASVDEGGTVAGQVQATDAENEALTYAVVSGPANGKLVFNGDGSFSYTHDGSETSGDSFAVDVTDASGATTRATVGITVTPVNDAPVVNGSATVAEGATVAGQVQATDAEKEALTYALVSGPANGKLTFGSDGAFSYTHDGSETSVDSFVVEVTDASGATTRATVGITVTPVNDAPVVNGSATVAEGGSAAGQVQAADAEKEVLTFALVSGPANGKLTFGSDGAFSYTHDGSETSADSFIVEVKDASGATTQATVGITVTPVNDAPVVSGSATVAEGGTVAGQVKGTDAENETLTYALASGTTNGTLTFNADGSFTYAHDGGETSADSFVVNVTDASGATTSGTVNITVTRVNDAPVATGNATVAEGGTVVGQVKGTDAENEALTYTLVSGTNNGSLTFSADGAFTYVHDGSETAADAFVVQVTDASGATSRGTVNITVTPVNDAPVVSGSATVAEGATVDGQVKATDAENEALAYTLVSGTKNGTLVFNADGSFRYTHDGSETSADAFVVDVTDAAGATTRSTVGITVTPVNDAPVVSGSATVAEGATVAGQVKATDAESEGLTYVLAGGPANGKLVFNADGSFSYTHDGSETSSDAFVVEVTDASGATSRGTVNITVTPVNDAPLVSGNATVAEGGTIAGQVKGTDAENDALTYALVGTTKNGTLVFNADGSFSYTHDASETSADAFVVDVTDASGATTRSTVGITVTPVNDAPVVSGSATVAEGGTVAGQVKGTDAENEALTYALVSGTVNGKLVFNSDGAFSYTHDGSETTTDGFVVDVTDASGATSRGTVSITVTPVNDAPVVSGSATVTEGGTVAGAVAAVDAENESVRFALVSDTSNGKLVFNADGSFSYTHDGSETAGDAFVVVASDASGATTRSTVNITVTPVNDAPTASGSATVAEGGTVDGQVTGIDAENDALRYTLVSGTRNGAITLNADGTFTYAHDGSETTADAFVVEVSDPSGATARATVNIAVTPVNDAPVVTGSSAGVAEGGTIASQLIATDAENETLTYALVSGPANGKLVFNADGSFSYAHDGSETLADAFVVDVADASGGTTRATVNITVTPVNDAPVAGGAATVAEGGTVAGQVNATDAEDEALRYTLVTGTANGKLALGADGSFSYTHDGSETRADAFVVDVTDASGATTRATVDITVTPVNDAPVVTGTATVAEGGAVIGRVQATDAENDALGFTLVSGTHNGVVTLNADGSFAYTHDGSETASDAFVVDVTDASGATTRSTVGITVTPVNDAPSASGSATVAEGGTVDGRVDGTDAENEALAYALVTGPANGSLRFNADGTFTYTHDGSETNVDAFVVDVTDASGATTRGTVQITVTPLNDAPSASGSAMVAEGGTVAGQVTGSDAENEALVFTLVSGPANGKLVFNADGSFSYTHDGSETSADSFLVDVADASNATTRATVGITVTPVNDAPVATGSATVAEGGAVDARVQGTDAEGEALRYALVSGTVHGQLAFNTDGSFRYTHDGSETRSDAFVVEVTDASGATSRSTIAITITPVNDAPAASGSATVAEGGTVSGQVTGTDAENDALRFTLVSGPAHGVLTFDADGSFRYTHDGSETRSDGFVVDVVDTSGASAQATVGITVTPVNDAPVLVASGTVAEGGTLAGQLAATDAENDAVGYALASGPAHGTLTFNADGCFSYTHDGSESASDAFVVDVTDAGGATSRSTVNITVTPVNDAPVAQAGSGSVAEGGTLDAQLAATDADGDTLRYTLVSGPAHGTVAVNADGSFSYTHDGSENFADAFSYRVTDPSGASSEASFRIGVVPVDDPTLTQADSLALAEDTQASGNVLANDSDVDSAIAVADFRVAGDDTLHAAGATAWIAGVGSLCISADGSYTFAPAADWNGAVPQVSYLTNTGATGTLSLVVTAVDDATRTAPDAAAGAEDVALAGNVLANDTDIDSALAITSFRVAGTDYAAGSSVQLRGVGTLTLATDGSWLYAPVADWSGTVPQVTYTTTTGATGTLAIQVGAVNDPPVRTGTLQDLDVAEGASASLGFAGVSYGPGGGSDEAGQTLTVRVTGVPAGLGTIVLADGTRVTTGTSYSVADLAGMTFQAAAGTSGSGVFSFTVSDGAGGTDSVADRFTIRVVNEAPVLDGANALPATLEDAAQNAGMLVQDLLAGHASDPGGRVGVAVVGAASNAGTWEFSRDGGAHWSAFEGVSEASAELLQADGQARIRFVPKADWNGSDAGLAFRAWDGTGGTADATRADATVHGGSSPFSAATAAALATVDAVNDAPVAPAQADVIAVAADAAGTPVDGLAWSYAPGGGSDEAGQAVTVTVTAIPGSEFGRLVLADGRTPVVVGGTYTPEQLRGLHLIAAPGSEGKTATLQWVVRDDGGTAHGGVDAVVGGVRLAVLTPAPTEVPPAQPVATPPAAPVPPAIVPAPRPAAADVVPATFVRGGGLGGDAAPEIRAPMLLPALDFGLTSRPVVEGFDASRVMGSSPRLPSDLVLVGYDAQGVEAFEITGLKDFEVRGTRLSLDQFQQSLRSGMFVEELNKLRDRLREEFDLDKTMSVSVAGLSLGVSVVYVLWLVRGGVLVGSYLSALPAWRLLDPLPVLASAGDEHEDDDDDEAFDPDDAGHRADPLRGFS